MIEEVERISVAEARWIEYVQAETHAMAVAARWTEAKAGRRMTLEVDSAMDEAEQQLRRAKRRYEHAARRVTLRSRTL